MAINIDAVNEAVRVIENSGSVSRIRDVTNQGVALESEDFIIYRDADWPKNASAEDGETRDDNKGKRV